MIPVIPGIALVLAVWKDWSDREKTERKGYGGLPVLALVPAAAPAAGALSAEVLSFLATIGLGGAALSMHLQSILSATPFDDQPNWSSESIWWKNRIRALSKSSRENGLGGGRGGGGGPNCSWILDPQTIMARVGQVTFEIATKSGRPPQSAASAVSKMLKSARSDWIDTMTGKPSWWSAALKKIGLSSGMTPSGLTAPMQAQSGYAMAITMPLNAVANSDFGVYAAEATLQVVREFATCVKGARKGLNSYLSKAVGAVFGSVSAGANKVLGAIQDSAAWLGGGTRSIAKQTLVFLVIEAISRYVVDNDLDKSILGRGLDLLDRTLTDSLVPEITPGLRLYEPESD